MFGLFSGVEGKGGGWTTMQAFGVTSLDEFEIFWVGGI